MAKKEPDTKNTIIDWFNGVKDKKLRELLFKRFDEHKWVERSLDQVATTFARAMDRFDWGETPEGARFWSGVAGGDIKTTDSLAKKSTKSRHVMVDVETINTKTSPTHYKTESGIEVIDVIEAFGLGFSLGNACKYLLRAGKKGGESTIHDLEKLKWYVDREISNLKK